MLPFLRCRSLTATGLMLAALATGSLAACSDDQPATIAEPSSTATADGSSDTLPDAVDETSSSVTTSLGSTPTGPETPPPTTTDPRSAQERLIEDRYQQFWEARAAANADPPNPDDPKLRDLATGSQLLNVIAETSRRREDGLAVRPASPSKGEHRVEVRALSGDTAELNDCSINDSVVYRPSTGEVVDDSVVTRSATATMRKIDGVWLLESASVVQSWKGVAGCALAES